MQSYLPVFNHINLKNMLDNLTNLNNLPYTIDKMALNRFV